MSKNHIRPESIITFLSLIAISFLLIGCAAKAESTAKPENKSAVKAETLKSEKRVEPKKAEIAVTDAERSKGAMIIITENSPADTVRVFYKRLREKKFRDAMMLTNLRPAIEGLTDSELKDLGVDFEFLAQKVPENMPINGEIVTGNDATVTVKMTDEETKRPEIQKIELRKDSDNWIVLVADEKGEKRAKKEGKNYFFALRMDVHHDEAKAMLDRIGKAQMIFSMNGGGKFTSLETLIKKGYVPEDAGNSASTGYNYKVVLQSSGIEYTALATPAEYAKTGKLSFALRITTDKQPQLISKDLRGAALLK